jgi:hypothetical protein
MCRLQSGRKAKRWHQACKADECSRVFPKEKEVLIPPSRFKVLEKQLTKEGFFFYLEEL